MQDVDWGKVAILAGGQTERDVSLESGQRACKALQAQGVDAIFLDVGAAPGLRVAQDVQTKLQGGGFDRVFIALHGGDGENGVVQAICEGLGLPYTGSDVLGCALAMDKIRSKQIWRALDLPVLPDVLLDLDGDLHAQTAHLPYPLAVKTVHGGSSLGVSRVAKPEDLEAAVTLARRYDNQVMVEPWVVGRELTVGVLSGTVLPVVEIITDGVWYDYEAKYNRDDTRYPILEGPADLIAKAQAVCDRAFKALGCAHWGRVDGMLDAQGQFFLLEVNTVPGLSSHSLVPKEAAALGWDFEAVIMRILASTLVGQGDEATV